MMVVILTGGTIVVAAPGICAAGMGRGNGRQKTDDETEQRETNGQADAQKNSPFCHFSTIYHINPILPYAMACKKTQYSCL